MSFENGLRALNHILTGIGSQNDWGSGVAAGGQAGLNYFERLRAENEMKKRQADLQNSLQTGGFSQDQAQILAQNPNLAGQATLENYRQAHGSPLEKETFSTQPVLYKDPAGNLGYAQIGSKNSVKTLKAPEGGTFVSPGEKTFDTAFERQAAAEVARDTQRYDTNLQTIEGLERNIHNLLDTQDLEGKLGYWSSKLPTALVGDDGREFRRRLSQVENQNFLRAYDSLRGGGAITDYEGKKATDAVSRLTNAQNAEQFKQAAKELTEDLIVAKRNLRNKTLRKVVPSYGFENKEQNQQQNQDNQDNFKPRTVGTGLHGYGY